MPQPQRKYTHSGFPKPDKHDEYDHEEIVWALIKPKYPYWPAQIKLDGGTVMCPKKLSNTKDAPMKRIPIVMFNDPELAITELTEQDIVNEATKCNRNKRRKKEQCTTRYVNKIQLLPWEAKKKSGEEISYEDVMEEFAKRCGYDSVSDVPENIFAEWNDNALVAAEAELKRITELKYLEQQRVIEKQRLMKAHRNEIQKQESLKNQWYDGRLPDTSRGGGRQQRKIGWKLHAGDRIRYWAECMSIGNQSTLIETTITCVRDKYGTLRLKDTVPVDVEHSGNPPFWDTEIEKLPSQDPHHPVYYPLSQCLLVPSQVDDQLELEHSKLRQEFNENMARKGFGNLLYTAPNHNLKHSGKKRKLAATANNNDNDNDSKKNKKKKKKSATNQDCVVNDSDLEILSNTTDASHHYHRRRRESDNANSNIVNDEESLNITFTQKKPKHKKRKRKHSMDSVTSDDGVHAAVNHDDARQLQSQEQQQQQRSEQGNDKDNTIVAAPQKKKRRLNATRDARSEQQQMLLIEESHNVSHGNAYLMIDSEDELILKMDTTNAPGQTRSEAIETVPPPRSKPQLPHEVIVVSSSSPPAPVMTETENAPLPRRQRQQRTKTNRQQSPTEADMNAEFACADPIPWPPSEHVHVSNPSQSPKNATKNKKRKLREINDVSNDMKFHVMSPPHNTTNNDNNVMSDSQQQSKRRRRSPMQASDCNVMAADISPQHRQQRKSRKTTPTTTLKKTRSPTPMPQTKQQKKQKQTPNSKKQNAMSDLSMYPKIPKCGDEKQSGSLQKLLNKKKKVTPTRSSNRGRKKSEKNTAAAAIPVGRKQSQKKKNKNKGKNQRVQIPPEQDIEEEYEAPKKQALSPTSESQFNDLLSFRF
mmetsp:Transcript_27814/g.45879  ORF Transcript_27814/g.45879 Transcript_27814/m.45879 type:complete len:871 (+) Transcript_27814:28-2640(+)